MLETLISNAELCISRYKIVYRIINVKLLYTTLTIHLQNIYFVTNQSMSSNNSHNKGVENIWKIFRSLLKLYLDTDSWTFLFTFEGNNHSYRSNKANDKLLTPTHLLPLHLINYFSWGGAFIHRWSEERYILKIKSFIEYVQKYN